MVVREEQRERERDEPGVDGLSGRGESEGALARDAGGGRGVQNCQSSRLLREIEGERGNVRGVVDELEGRGLGSVGGVHVEMNVEGRRGGQNGVRVSGWVSRG